MLKKSLFVMFFACFLAYSTHGFTDQQNCCFLENRCLRCIEYDKWHPALEVKFGYFYFSNSKMRKIFDRGGIDVQISSFYPIYKWLQIYGSIEYLERNGKSSEDQKTKIWETPFSLGLKVVIPVCNKIQSYFTLGPRYFFVHVHNQSSFVERNLKQNGLGGFANIGLNFSPCNHLLIDLFGEYSYGRLHFHSSKKNNYGQTMQIGGFAFGAGIGYFF